MRNRLTGNFSGEIDRISTAYMCKMRSIVLHNTDELCPSIQTRNSQDDPLIKTNLARYLLWLGNISILYRYRDARLDNVFDFGYSNMA